MARVFQADTSKDGTWLQREDIARFIWAPPLARFVFRGGAAAEVAAGPAFGLTFPIGLNRAASKGERGQPGGRVALRLGPDEVLLIVPVTEGEAVSDAIGQACGETPHALVDISDRHLGFVLEGPHAADLINSGCPLDLDEAAFPVGMVTRTLFHKAEIVLWRMALTVFRVETGRSFAPYVEAHLQEAVKDHF
jgi:sarcosine oxidase subunit gamma